MHAPLSEVEYPAEQVRQVEPSAEHEAQLLIGHVVHCPAVLRMYPPLQAIQVEATQHVAQFATSHAKQASRI